MSALVETRSFVPVTEMRQSYVQILERVNQGETIIVMRNNEPILAMISIAELGRLQEIERKAGGRS